MTESVLLCIHMCKLCSGMCKCDLRFVSVYIIYNNYYSHMGCQPVTVYIVQSDLYTIDIVFVYDTKQDNNFPLTLQYTKVIVYYYFYICL